MKLLYVLTLFIMPISLNFAYAMDCDIQPTGTGRSSVVINGTQKQVYNDVEDWLKYNDPVYNTKQLKKLIKLSRINSLMACAR